MIRPSLTVLPAATAIILTLLCIQLARLSIDLAEQESLAVSHGFNRALVIYGVQAPLGEAVAERSDGTQVLPGGLLSSSALSAIRGEPAVARVFAVNSSSWTMRFGQVDHAVQVWGVDDDFVSAFRLGDPSALQRAQLVLSMDPSLPVAPGQPDRATLTLPADVVAQVKAQLPATQQAVLDDLPVIEQTVSDERYLALPGYGRGTSLVYQERVGARISTMMQPAPIFVALLVEGENLDAVKTRLRPLLKRGQVDARTGVEVQALQDYLPRDRLQRVRETAVSMGVGLVALGSALILLLLGLRRARRLALELALRRVSGQSVRAAIAATYGRTGLEAVAVASAAVLLTLATAVGLALDLPAVVRLCAGLGVGLLFALAVWALIGTWQARAQPMSIVKNYA